MSSSLLGLGRGGRKTAHLFGQMLLCSLLWAPAFLLLQRIGVDLSPLALTAVRDLLGGAAMALWFAFLGERILPAGREWGDWAVLGVLQVIVPNTLTVYALGEITTSLASLIQSSTPLLVALIAPFLFASERLTRGRVLGLGFGLGGLVLLLGGVDLLRVSHGSVPGTLAMAGVPVSYALGNIYVRLVPDAPPARLAYGQLVFSGLPCLAVVLAFNGPAAFSAAGDHLLDLAVLSLVSTAAPLIMFMRILRLAGPTVGTMVGYLVPVWTILIGAGLFGETLQMHEVLGAALLFVGVVAASSSRPASPHPSCDAA